MTKVLIVFYSRTGFTRKAVTEVARRTGWDLAEINDNRASSGLWSYSRCLIESSFGLDPHIEYHGPDPGTYDVVLLASPVWGFHIASPIRSFCVQHRQHLKRVAFLFTFGGGGADAVTRQAIKLVGKADTPTLFLPDSEMDSGRFRDRIDDFIGRIRAVSA